MTIRLSENDKKLLEEIGKYGVITINAAGKIYNTKKYHKSRLTVLYKEKYIIRKMGLIYIGHKGTEYLENINAVIKKTPTNKYLRKRTGNVLDLMSRITEWEVLPSWQVKEDYNLDKGGRYYGLIRSKDNRMLEYIVYKFGKTTKENAINYVTKKEMKQLSEKGIYRSIVFAETPEIMKMFENETSGLSEKLLMPYAEIGFQIINALGREDINQKAVNSLYGNNVQYPNWRDADYRVEDRDIFVMITNDAEKQVRLRSYLDLTKIRHTAQSIIEIICLYGQEEKFINKYPECIVKTVPVSILDPEI